MIAESLVNEIIEKYLVDTDYYLVEAKVTHDNRITVEIDSFDGVSIDFCIKLNKHIEAQFDREVEDFELEVSSAGLSEPFKVLKQYEKNIGNEVEVLTKAGKKLCGTLITVGETAFTIQLEKMEKLEGAKRKTLVVEDITYNYEDIKTTKYNIRFK